MSDGPILPDLADIALKSGLLTYYRASVGLPNATLDDMFADVMEPGNKAKDVRAAVMTNSSGVFSVTYPAGFWKAEPSINVAPISATGGNGQLTFKVSKVSVSNAWTISISFAMLPASVNVVVAGSTSLWVNPGVVTFDYQGFETT